MADIEGKPPVDEANGDKVRTHGFIVAIELEDDSQTSIDSICLRLGDATSFMEGVLYADVEYLGEIELVEEGDVPTDAKPVKES